MLTWWSEEEGGIYKLNQASVTLAHPYPTHYSKWAPVANLKSDGTWLMTGPSFVSRRLLTTETVKQWALANGFTASRNPLLHGADLSNTDSYENVVSVLEGLSKIVGVGVSDG